MSRERVSDFDQWKTVSRNYKPMRVWKWLACKFAENNCRWGLVAEFIETRKSYSTSLDKIRILKWRLLVTSSQTFSCGLNSSSTYSSRNISYLSLRLVPRNYFHNCRSIFVLLVLFVLTLVFDMVVSYANGAFSVIVLSTQKHCSSILKKFSVFQKICFKGKVIKPFKIYSKIKMCRFSEEL